MNKRLLKNILMMLFATLLLWSCGKDSQNRRARWTEKKANEWSEKVGWLRGSDFIPSNAINQLEMWQAETFDTVAIKRELGWAAGLGMNCMRVYLHHLAWQIDKEGFKERMNKYLSIADRYNIKTIFVFFDDCWNPTYASGKQPDPKPGIHNSGWVQDPGKLIEDDPSIIELLETYVKDVLSTFKDDKRIALWDLYNEPGNGHGNKSMLLLKKVFEWGREVNPSQPLSSGVWISNLPELSAFQLANSDVITYHNYSTTENHKAAIDSLRRFDRPLVCTEYMARTRGSRFENILPLLKKEKVGAINWGLVSGKTNTMYQWGDATHLDGSEPNLWFHDIFRKDGTPYLKEETDLIRKECLNQ